jgi:uncharacterized protein with GYD domain
MSLNDHDLPAQILQKKKNVFDQIYSMGFFPLILLLQITLISLPESVQESFFETVITGGINFTIVGFTIAGSVNFFVVIMAISVFFSVLLLREVETERQRRKIRSKAVMPINIDYQDSNNTLDQSDTTDLEQRAFAKEEEEKYQKEDDSQVPAQSYSKYDKENDKESKEKKPLNRFSYRSRWLDALRQNKTIGALIEIEHATPRVDEDEQSKASEGTLSPRSFAMKEKLKNSTFMRTFFSRDESFRRNSRLVETVATGIRDDGGGGAQLSPRSLMAQRAVKYTATSPGLHPSMLDIIHAAQSSASNASSLRSSPVEDVMIRRGNKPRSREAWQTSDTASPVPRGGDASTDVKLFTSSDVMNRKRQLLYDIQLETPVHELEREAAEYFDPDKLTAEKAGIEHMLGSIGAAFKETLTERDFAAVLESDGDGSSNQLNLQIQSKGQAEVPQLRLLPTESPKSMTRHDRTAAAFAYALDALDDVSIEKPKATPGGRKAGTEEVDKGLASSPRSGTGAGGGRIGEAWTPTKDSQNEESSNVSAFRALQKVSQPVSDSPRASPRRNVVKASTASAKSPRDLMRAKRLAAAFPIIEELEDDPPRDSSFPQGSTVINPSGAEASTGDAIGGQIENSPSRSRLGTIRREASSRRQFVQPTGTRRALIRLESKRPHGEKPMEVEQVEDLFDEMLKDENKR